MAKVELHRHLELSIRHSTLSELAPQFGIKADTPETFSHHFLITEPMKDLGAVLHKFQDTQRVLGSEEIIERISFEAVEDAFNEGIRILELRYAPTFLQQGHEHLDFKKIHRSIIRGIQRAESQFPIAVGLIGIIQRTMPVQVATKVTDFVLENKDSFVGLDLADNEDGFDSKPFAPLFKRAKDAGLGITIHAGEIDSDKAPRYVQEAVEYLGADRIGHGVQIYRNLEVMKFIRDHGVPLELCPTSNYLTQSVKSVDQHPFKKLMDFGIKTTINSDDPGIFNIDLTNEYELLYRKLGLTLDDLRTCTQTAANVSFIQKEKKQSVWPEKLG